MAFLERSRNRISRPLTATGAAVGPVSTVLASALILAGCSVPYWANPVEWYDSATADSSSTASQSAKAAEQKVTTDKDGFPVVASVPERPKAETTPKQRQEIARGLVADRTNAQYTDQALRARQPRSVAPPPAPPPPPAKAPATASAAPSLLPKLKADEKAPPPAPPPPSSTAAAAKAAPKAAPMAPPATRSTALPPAPPSTTAAALAARRVPSQPVPSIVQRSATVAPPLIAGTPAPAPAAMTATGKPPYPPLNRRRTPAPLPTVAPRATAAAPAMTMAATIPPAQAAVPRLGLPVTAEQRTLDQVYAGHLAAQASSRYPTAAQPGVVRTAAVPIAPAGAGSSVIINGSAAAVTSPGFAGNGSRLVVKFAHGVSALSGPARRQLKDFAPQVVGHPGLVRVVGHASQRTGDMSYGRHVAANFNVSVDRANAVAGELARLGVDPSRLVVEAVADSQPRYHESMPNGESENRRVEIYLE